LKYSSVEVLKTIVASVPHLETKNRDPLEQKTYYCSLAKRINQKCDAQENRNGESGIRIAMC
jgi:hypothetical protein